MFCLQLSHIPEVNAESKDTWALFGLIFSDSSALQAIPFYKAALTWVPLVALQEAVDYLMVAA